MSGLKAGEIAKVTKKGGMWWWETITGRSGHASTLVEAWAAADQDLIKAGDVLTDRPPERAGGSDE